MAGRLSFSVAVNLLTDQFNRGANQLRSGLRNIQMQAMAMVAAMGVGSLGLGEFVSNLITTARETNRYTTALKNVSGGAKEFWENQKFLISISQKYGLYINDLTGNFSKFTAAATVANMSMKDQQFIFESLSRASTGFGLSADETNGVFLAVTQMMGKGKIQAEELRGQLGERMPIAMQAMARAAGTTVAGLDKIMKAGKLLSADIMPKFAKALNEMMPNVSTDNVETSFNRLKNKFKELTDALNVGSIYKGLLDQTNIAFSWILGNLKTVGNGIVNVVSSIIIGKAFLMVMNAYKALGVTALRFYRQQAVLSGVAFDQMAFNANKFRNIATVAFARVGVALKTAFASFAPMLIISGLIAIYQHFADIASKTKELKAVWDDYQSGLQNAGQNDSAVKDLKKLQAVIYDTTKSLDDRKTALNEINTILGTNYEFDKRGLSIAGDINSKIKDRLNLLEKTAELNYAINSKIQAGDKVSEKTNEISTINNQLRSDINSGKGVSTKLVNKRTDLQNELNALTRVYDDASNKVLSIKTSIEKISPTPKKGTIITDSGTGTKVKETDLEKAEKNHIQQLNEYNNQLANGTISVKEYNELFDKLVKDSKEKLGGLLTPAQAKNNVLFQSVKNQKPLTNGTDKLNDVETEYIDSKKDLDIELKLGYISQQDYNTAFESLIKSTIKTAYKIDSIDVAGTEFIKGLFGKKKELDKAQPKEKNVSKYDYVSPYESLGKTDIEVAGINLDKAKEELNTLKEFALKTTDDLTAQLDEKLSNVNSLDKALNLLEVKKQVKDLEKELSTGVYTGIKDIANSAKNLYEGFKAVGDVISNVDSTGWDKFLAIWDALTNTVDSIMSVIKLIESLTAVTTALGVAKQTEAVIDTAVTSTKVINAGIGAGAVVAAATTETAANTAVAGSGAAASVASVPIIGPVLAIAAVAGIIGLLTTLPKFANGGIVGGSSYTGDKILAGLNSGELILNQQQQNKLLNNNSNGGVVKFRIEGKDLVGTIANYNKIKSKV